MTGKSMKKNRASALLLLVGLLLVASALLWAEHNTSLSRRAGEATREIVEALDKQIPRTIPIKQPESIEQPQSTPVPVPVDLPDYVLNPDMPMPVCEVKGVYYIGTLSIPTLDLELSVASELDYPTLDLSPCRYFGSAYKDNLVLSAHNYDAHFGRIGSLTSGTPLTFTDMDGNVFRYRVATVEILLPYDSDLMTESGYPLTLFTCTVGGRYRVTVRCTYAETA